jgi:ATP-binding cassette subfamily E protein 1
VLDYLSDFICVLYGVPGAYGAVTMPFSVREGINIFLAGFDPTENLRFRDFSLSFKPLYDANREDKKQSYRSYEYPDMTKTWTGSFTLNVGKGCFTDSEIIVLLGKSHKTLSSTLRPPLSALRPPPSALRPPPSALCPPPSALRPPPSALRPPPSSAFLDPALHSTLS